MILEEQYLRELAQPLQHEEHGRGPEVHHLQAASLLGQVRQTTLLSSLFM